MKRFVCFLLAMIMIMGMVPATAVTASAAVVERTTSDKALDLLARFEGFEAKKYQVGDKYYIGYGTQIGAQEYPNGITESVARQIMKDYMKNVDKTLNKFAAANNHQLTQYEHDALAIFSYSFDGTGNWLLNGSGPLRAAVLHDKTGNEFINAIAQSNGGDPSKDNQVFAGLMNRRLAEANLYLNNSYNYYAPKNYTYVVLDANGDERASKGDTVIAYNSDTYPLLTNVPETAAGKDFAGWYRFDGLDMGMLRGEPIVYLDASTAGQLLVAKFVDSGSERPTAYSINTAALQYRHVFHDHLSKSDWLYGLKMEFGNAWLKTGLKGKLKHNTLFHVTRETMVDGVKWIFGFGTDENDNDISGWVYYGELPTQSEGQYGTILATAKVTAATLSVYESATNGNGEYTPVIVGTLKQNDVVNIYEFKVEATETGNKNWGRISYNGINGWINLVYTKVTEAQEGDNQGTIGSTGTIVGADNVNVRSSAGIEANNLITSIPRDTRVLVLETKTVAGSQWARVRWEKLIGGYNEGWVYMYYIHMDGDINDFDNGTSDSDGAPVLYTGVVTSNINLNIREYPSASTNRLGSLPNGTKINIYETTTYNGVEWGLTYYNGITGWVCLQYVNLTKVEAPDKNTETEEGITTLQATVTTTSLNVLKNYNSNAAVVGTLEKGETVTILEKNTEITTTGSRIWGRIVTEKVAGWINLAYVHLKNVTTVTPGTGNSDNNTTAADPIPAVITDCISVNVRNGAGVNNTALTKLNNGTAVTVVEQVTKDNAPWARILWNNGSSEGWVCMYYLTLNAGTGSANTNSNGIINGTSSNAISATGTVNNVYLNVRAGAGLNFAQVGTLNQGAKVTIFEQAVSDGLIWGRINYNNSSAWVCMTYITVESASSTGKGVMGTIARCFSKANVRSAPGTGNALVATVNVGSRVEVFEVKTHAAQQWGRIPQGWICMEYVLLDSELPEGTILDATTAPTTEATTAPADETVNKVGEVAFKIEAGVLTKINVYNDATAKSTRVGTITDGLGVDIHALKNNGAELWGRVDQYGTAGWICLSDGTTAYAFEGYVNTENAPVYVEADTNSAVKGSLAVNKKMKFNKVTTDGENVYGWVEEGIYGWLPMSKISSEPVEVMTVLKNGDAVGSSKFNPFILQGTTFADVNAYDVIGGSKVLFKMQSGVHVSVNKVRFENGKVWALLQQPKKPGFRTNWAERLDYSLDSGEYSEYGEAWFDLSKVNYSLPAYITDDQSKVAVVRSSMVENTNSNIVGEVRGIISLCQLTFDSYGNLWARITGNENTQLNGMFILVRYAAQGIDGYEVDGKNPLTPYVVTSVTPNGDTLAEMSEPTEATEGSEGEGSEGEGSGTPDYDGPDAG